MDLALELGQPVELLARHLTESEFRLWGRYARKRLLPLRRLELYLARISMLIATTMGGAKSASLEDFLIHPPDDDTEPDDDVPDLEAAKRAFGFKPVN